jgi:hypothetical protein
MPSSRDPIARLVVSVALITSSADRSATPDGTWLPFSITVAQDHVFRTTFIV